MTAVSLRFRGVCEEDLDSSRLILNCDIKIIRSRILCVIVDSGSFVNYYAMEIESE